MSALFFCIRHNEPFCPVSAAQHGCCGAAFADGRHDLLTGQRHVHIAHIERRGRVFRGGHLGHTDSGTHKGVQGGGTSARREDGPQAERAGGTPRRCGAIAQRVAAAALQGFENLRQSELPVQSGVSA